MFFRFGVRAVAHPRVTAPQRQDFRRLRGREVALHIQLAALAQCLVIGAAFTTRCIAPRLDERRGLLVIVATHAKEFHECLLFVGIVLALLLPPRACARAFGVLREGAMPHPLEAPGSAEMAHWASILVAKRAAR
jgi:hypothetical protein